MFRKKKSKQPDIQSDNEKALKEQIKFLKKKIESLEYEKAYIDENSAVLLMRALNKRAEHELRNSKNKINLELIKLAIETDKFIFSDECDIECSALKFRELKRWAQETIAELRKENEELRKELGRQNDTSNDSNQGKEVSV